MISFFIDHIIVDVYTYDLSYRADKMREHIELINWLVSSLRAPNITPFPSFLLLPKADVLKVSLLEAPPSVFNLSLQLLRLTSYSYCHLRTIVR
jgi:hypothetical protein